MLVCAHYSRFPYLQDHKWKLPEHETYIYLLSWFLSLVATYIWNSVISPQHELTYAFQCFSRLTGHKGELNMNMHANLISSLCNQLKVVFNIEETVFFFLVSTNNFQHFCFWQIRGHTREDHTKLWERQFKEKVGKEQNLNWGRERGAALYRKGTKQRWRTGVLESLSK